VINNCFDLLKENGTIILNLPALNAFKGIHDLSVGVNHRFSKIEMPDFIDPNLFVIKKKMYWPFLLSPLIYLVRLKQRFDIRYRKNFFIQSDIYPPQKYVSYS
jgi:hypothetical protein